MKRRILAILMVVLFTISLCAFNRPKEDLGIDIEFNYYADYWEAYDFSNTPYPTQEEFKALVKSEMLEVCELLGYEEFWTYANPDAQKIVIDVQFQGLPKSEAGWFNKFGDKGVLGVLYMGFDTSGMGLDSALSHELTHLMNGRTFSISVQEGVCEYVRMRVGYSSELLSMAEDGVELEEQEYLKLEYEWYLLSHSFISYLIENYDMDDVLLIMQQGEDESAYEQYIGKSLEELKDEWWTYFEALEPSFTPQELVEMLTGNSSQK